MATPKSSGNALLDNPTGIKATGNGNPVIAENTIEDCTAYGISQTIESSQTAEVRIHDNVVERCGNPGAASIRVEASGSGSTLAGITLAGNTVADGGGRAIVYSVFGAGSTVPPDIDETRSPATPRTRSASPA